MREQQGPRGFYRSLRVRRSSFAVAWSIGPLLLQVPLGRARHSARFAATVLALAGAHGCNSEAPEFAIAVPAYTRVIEHRPVSAAERTARIALREDLVLPAAPESAEQSLLRPRDLAVDDDGVMYVLDAAERKVQVFDAAGAWLRTLGRAGQGPAELERPSQVVVAGDRVVVFDGATLEVWDQGGAHVGQLRTELPVQGTGWAEHDGDAFTVLFSVTADPEHPLETTEQRVGRVTMDGRREVTFHTALLQEVVFPRGGIPVPLGFSRLLAAVGSDTLFVVDANAYQVVAFALDGTPHWTIVVPWERSAITEGQIDRAMAIIARVVPDAHRSEVAWPPANPVIADIAVDGAGRLWVIPDFSDAPPGTTEVAVDVYDPAGERLFAGTIDLPFIRERGVFGDKPTLWLAALGEFVYGFRRDPASGEVEVARYLLEVPF